MEVLLGKVQYIKEETRVMISLWQEVAAIVPVSLFILCTHSRLFIYFYYKAR